MKMPNNFNSFVAEVKITDYLLCHTHEFGKTKAKYFSKYGFTEADVDTFKKALIQHSILRDFESEQTNAFGVKYKLTCKIQTPDNRNPCIVTVWIVEAGTDVPRLITAYPN